MGPIEELLRRQGISNFVPGFMDDPAFVAGEQSDHRFLENYARYIEEQNFDAAYLAFARERIERLAKYLYPLLVKEGRLGSCVDASASMARMLEREGVWCYVVRGSLSIYPESWTSLAPSHFAPVSRQEVDSPHAWIVAPPFRVVDMTIRLQPHSKKGEARVLPEYLLADNAGRGTMSIKDWTDPFYWAELAASLGHEPTLADIPHIVSPEVRSFVDEFGTWEVKGRRAMFRYTPIAIGGADVQLEKMNCIRYAGQSADETYRQFRSLQPI